MINSKNKIFLFLIFAFRREHFSFVELKMFMFTFDSVTKFNQLIKYLCLLFKLKSVIENKFNGFVCVVIC